MKHLENCAISLVGFGSREGLPGQCDCHHWCKHGSPGFEAITMKLARDKETAVEPDIQVQKTAPTLSSAYLGCARWPRHFLYNMQWSLIHGCQRANKSKTPTVKEPRDLDRGPPFFFSLRLHERRRPGYDPDQPVLTILTAPIIRKNRQSH